MGYSEKTVLSLNSKGCHRIAYSDWGDKNANPIVCVHGLTGNGRDFDILAEKFVQNGHRIIAMDLPGRGRSDLLEDSQDYSYSQYWQDILCVLNHAGITEPHSVDWLGISMGGLLGFYMAALSGSPIKRLIVNDIGPSVPQEALDFIHDIICQDYRFDTMDAFEERLRMTRGMSWGPMKDEHWRKMAEDHAWPLEDGSITYGFDPAIAIVFKTEPTGPFDLWEHWRKIKLPVMVIHGGQSQVLTDAIIQKMRDDGPDFEYLLLDDCGHAPSLMADNQIDAIKQWLSKTA